MIPTRLRCGIVASEDLPHFEVLLFHILLTICISSCEGQLHNRTSPSYPNSNSLEQACILGAIIPCARNSIWYGPFETEADIASAMGLDKDRDES